MYTLGDHHGFLQQDRFEIYLLAIPIIEMRTYKHLDRLEISVVCSAAIFFFLQFLQMEILADTLLVKILLLHKFLSFFYLIASINFYFKKTVFFDDSF